MKTDFLRVALGGRKIKSRLGFSITRGLLDEDGGELVDGTFSEEGFLSFFSIGLLMNDYEYSN